MCEVTIVIPNYKGKEYLFSCVKSLYEKDQTEKKILIIDCLHQTIPHMCYFISTMRVHSP